MSVNGTKVITGVVRASFVHVFKPYAVKADQEAKYSLMALIDKINDRLMKKEQVILLLNRRGYSSMLTCRDCGSVLKCPNCDITLTYHKTSGMARCHYCGYTKLNSDICPSCKEDAIRSFGTGTEKLENEIKKLFPKLLLTDSTTRRIPYEKTLLYIG